jgi:hypothetical protein
MNHHDRIGLGLPVRDLELHERLPDHWHVALALDVFAADVEIALPGNHQRLVSRAADR